MLDVAPFRALFATATSRALASLGDRHVDDLELADLVLEQLDSLDTILATAAGTGRTAEGDALADRLWVELGIEARL